MKRKPREKPDKKKLDDVFDDDFIASDYFSVPSTGSGKGGDRESEAAVEADLRKNGAVGEPSRSEPSRGEPSRGEGGGSSGEPRRRRRRRRRPKKSG
ncbi:MAG: hypothetical protein O7J95_04655 [Planctomycetota bacterium]|nr:hypothetical protein [Planctomycetota bacterium]